MSFAVDVHRSSHEAGVQGDERDDSYCHRNVRQRAALTHESNGQRHDRDEHHGQYQERPAVPDDEQGDGAVRADHPHLESRHCTHPLRMVGIGRFSENYTPKTNNPRIFRCGGAGISDGLLPHAAILLTILSAQCNRGVGPVAGPHPCLVAPMRFRDLDDHATDVVRTGAPARIGDEDAATG